MTSTQNPNLDQAAESHGDDKSPRVTPRRLVKEAVVAKTALKLSQALGKACDAMNAYTRACRDADLPFKGADDGRVLLLEDMVEYAVYLQSVYEKDEVGA